MSTKGNKGHIYTASIGYVYKSKIDGAILTNVLILGIDDSIDNYEEVLIEEVNEDGED